MYRLSVFTKCIQNIYLYSMQINYVDIKCPNKHIPIYICDSHKYARPHIYICDSHKYMQQEHNIPGCHTIHISCQRALQKTHRFFCKIRNEHLKKDFPPSSGGGKYPGETQHNIALHESDTDASSAQL